MQKVPVLVLQAYCTAHSCCTNTVGRPVQLVHSFEVCIPWAQGKRCVLRLAVRAQVQMNCLLVYCCDLIPRVSDTGPVIL
jgi:hypothetical protein